MSISRNGTLPNKLKRMLNAVSDTETENPPLWGMGIVAATVATSFLMSLATKEFSVMVSDYNGNISPGLMALGIALLQVIIIALVFRIGNLNFSTSPANREAVIFAAFAHAGAMFLISYRHWDSVTGSSVFYGAQEPVLCMSLLLIAAGISTDLFKFGAVAAMSIGAALLTADFNIYLDRTSLIRIVTSLFFLTRNIVVKHLYDSNVNIMLRGQSTVISVGGCATVTAVFFTLAAERALLPATLVMIAGCFMSAMLLHLTMLMLTLYDNLTVAVFMLWGQVLENAVFVVGVSRPDIISVILGALLFAGGHYVYFKEGLDSGTIHLNIKRVGGNELITRLEFILYAACIIGLIICILQPRISDRDISFLSYVGLDSIARKLLHPDEH